MNKRTLTALILIINVCLILTGCQMRREISVSLSDESSAEAIQNDINKIYVDHFAMDRNTITTLFLGLSEAEAEEYYNPDASQYYTGDEFLIFFRDTFCEYRLLSEQEIGSRYYFAIDPEAKSLVNQTLGSWTRQYYPLDGLETCSKEEVLEICQPYAEAFGYGENAEAHVFAMTLDTLLKSKNQWIEEYEWEKSDEALRIFYFPSMDGKTVNSASNVLELIYVPKYKKIVYAYGGSALQQRPAEHVEKQEIAITKEEAVEAAMLAIGIHSQDSFEIEKISLQYYAPIQYFYQTDENSVLTPCWKIDYANTDKLWAETPIMSLGGSILIDALSGEVIK